MVWFTRGLGAALLLVGIVAYLATGAESITALFPAFLGVPLLVLGLLAGRESARQHAIHGALVLALLGVLASAMPLAELPALLTGGEVERPVATVTSAITALACLIYLGVGVRSFVVARRSGGSMAT